MIIEGSLAVKAVLEGGNHVCRQLLIDENKHSKDLNYILHLCHSHQVPFKRITKEACDEIAQGKTHGGILLECELRKYQQVSEVTGDLALLVEGVEDPFNLGMIIRSAYIMGVTTIITSQRHFNHSEPVLIKASAGASEKVVWIADNDFTSTINQLKQQGFKLVMADRNNQSISLSDVVFPKKTILAIGGELRGLSKQVKALSDVSMVIEYPFNARIALSAVSATAMCLYEISRQRQGESIER